MYNYHFLVTLSKFYAPSSSYSTFPPAVTAVAFSWENISLILIAINIINNILPSILGLFKTLTFLNVTFYNG